MKKCLATAQDILALCDSAPDCNTKNCTLNQCALQVLGGECSLDSYCATGACGPDNTCMVKSLNGGICNNDVDCADGTCISGVCKGAIGDECTGGDTVCTTGACYSNSCIAVRTNVNDTCDSAPDCWTGNCDVNGKCQKLGLNGDCKNDDTLCASGACYTTGCIAKGNVGDLCNSAADCNSNNCNGTTCIGIANGSPCPDGNDASCQSGACIFGTCNAKLWTLSNCDSASDCQSGLLCSFVLYNGNRVCKHLQGGNGTCLSGLTMPAYSTCQGKIFNGEACSASTQCQSGVCDGTKCIATLLPQGGEACTGTNCFGTCTAGVCIAKAGGSCNFGYDCLSGVCSGGICQGVTGDMCMADNNCQSGICTNYTCYDPWLKNAACGIDFGVYYQTSQNGSYRLSTNAEAVTLCSSMGGRLATRAEANCFTAPANINFYGGTSVYILSGQSTINDFIIDRGAYCGVGTMQKHMPYVGSLGSNYCYTEGALSSAATRCVKGTSSIPATIRLSPSTLAFSSSVGVAPASQPFTIYNDGGNALNWTSAVSGNNGSLSPSVGGTITGGSNAVMRLYPNATNTPGTFNYQITISDPSASPTSQTINVTQTATAVAPTIGLSTNSLSFTAVAGGSAPATKNFTISNSGNANLNWQATVSPNTAGCALSSYSNTIITGGPGSVITVSVPNPVTAGTRDCTITISDPTASNNPQTVVVSYNVTSGAGTATIAFTLNYGSYGYLYTNSVNTPHSLPFTIRNTGTAPLTWSASSNNPSVCSPAQSSGGPISVGGSQVVNMNLGALSMGYYSCLITVFGSAPVSNSPQSFYQYYTVEDLAVCKYSLNYGDSCTFDCECVDAWCNYGMCDY